MSNQAVVFLAMAAFGVAAGFVYDWVRLLRRLVSRGGLAAQIEDVLFWILASGVAFFFLLRLNFGEVRGFAIVGMFLGMFLYFVAVSPVFMRAAIRVTDAISAAARKVMLPIVRPPVLFARRKIAAGARRGKRALSSGRRYVRIKKITFARQIRIIREKR